MTEEALACVLEINSDKLKSKTLAAITTEQARLGNFEQAKACASDIVDYYWKSTALKNLSTELDKNGLRAEASAVIHESLVYARSGCDDYESFALADISTVLAMQGQLTEAQFVMEEAIKIARGVNNGGDKSRLLAFISTELHKQKHHEASMLILNESLEFARGINDNYWKSDALFFIPKELVKHGNWTLAESAAWEIPQILDRQLSWKAIAKLTYKYVGWKDSLMQFKQLRTDEARLFYLKGWIEALNYKDTDNICIQEVLSHFAHDSEGIETLLRKYALHEVFFGNAGREKINQLNRTLNIQWALDIAAQFPKPEATTRFSTNLDTWLHEIADEDDREQIELWAKQVVKGKITEEEFGERVRGLLN
jgi:tetratricopeptide (TPR) repeat protein